MLYPILTSLLRKFILPVTLGMSSCFVLSKHITWGQEENQGGAQAMPWEPGSWHHEPVSFQFSLDECQWRNWRNVSVGHQQNQARGSFQPHAVPWELSFAKLSQFWLSIWSVLRGRRHEVGALEEPWQHMLITTALRALLNQNPVPCLDKPSLFVSILITTYFSCQPFSSQCRASGR